MGRLLEIAVSEKAEEARALFRAAAKDAIYALMEAQFALLPAARDQAAVAWLQRAVKDNRFAALGDALMDLAFCRDAKVRSDGRAAEEADVARLVAEHLPKFVSLDL